jgi:CelD/BcsL family acetyltransferase involved in cellulose biosynthesis
MIIDRIESLSKFEALRPEWQELEARLPPLPFLTFDWLYTWWIHLRARRPGVRDELFLHVFRDHGGKLRGVVPLMRTRRPAYGPLRLRQLQFLGADPNITEIRSIVAAPEDMGAVVRGLVEQLRASASEWDFMQFTGLPAEHTNCIDASAFRTVRWVYDMPNYVLKLAPTWDEFRSKLSRNIKESLRKCYNAPKRDGVEFELEVVRRPSEVPGAIAAFLRLHEARSQREDTVRHGNVFGGPRRRDFLLDVCTRFAEVDRLRIFQLKIAGAVVATRIGLCCHDSLYLYYSGFDSEYSRYSIMTTTVAEALQFAIREGFKTVNLSTGNDVSKLRWGPDEHIYRELLLVSPSLRGAIAHESYSLVRRGFEAAFSDARVVSLLSRRS